MKTQLTTIFLALIFFITPVSASLPVAEIDAGITPDHPLWPIDLAIEQIFLDFFPMEAHDRARASIHNAQERMAEIEIMIHQGKLGYALRAEIEYNKSLNRTEIEIERVRDEILLIEIERELSIHINQTHAVRERLEIEIEGMIPQAEWDMIRAILNNISLSRGEVEIEIETARGRIEVEFERNIEQQEDVLAEFEPKILGKEIRVDGLERVEYDKIQVIVTDNDGREILGRYILSKVTPTSIMISEGEDATLPVVYVDVGVVGYIVQAAADGVISHWEAIQIWRKVGWERPDTLVPDPVPDRLIPDGLWLAPFYVDCPNCGLRCLITPPRDAVTLPVITPLRCPACRAVVFEASTSGWGIERAS